MLAPNRHAIAIETGETSIQVRRKTGAGAHIGVSHLSRPHIERWVIGEIHRLCIWPDNIAERIDPRRRGMISELLRRNR